MTWREIAATGITILAAAWGMYENRAAAGTQSEATTARIGHHELMLHWQSCMMALQECMGNPCEGE